MTDPVAYALLTTAAATGLLHTLIPDHWLPFVLMGRAQSWSTARAAGISGLAALVHAGVSTVLGLAALTVGLGAAQMAGETMERVSALLLILFGLAYAAWSWRKGGHFHPGGARVHAHIEENACAGNEGDRHPEHLHYHADDHLIDGCDSRGSLWLALLVGLNPCVLLVPVVLAAAPHGGELTGMVIAAYTLPTALLMVGLSTLGVSVGWRIRLPIAARYMELASGLIIAGLGVVHLLRGH